MDTLEQLKVELSEAQKKRVFFEEQLKNLSFCVDVLEREVAYRAN